MKFGDFWVAITGPNDYEWHGHFDDNGVIVRENLEPGWYTITEEAPGYPFTATGNGPVKVEYEKETVVSIVNDGSTTSTGRTSTTSSFITSSTGGTGTTGTTQRLVSSTVFGTSSTVFGWVMEPDDIQTGLGGTAGGGNAALLILILSSTLLASVLVASAVGVRAGIL